jgi:hypothetical protein
VRKRVFGGGLASALGRLSAFEDGEWDGGRGVMEMLR